MARAWKTPLSRTGEKQGSGLAERRLEEGGLKDFSPSKSCYRRSVFTTMSVVKGLEIMNINCSARNKTIQTTSLERSF